MLRASFQTSKLPQYSAVLTYFTATTCRVFPDHLITLQHWPRLASPLDALCWRGRRGACPICVADALCDCDGCLPRARRCIHQQPPAARVTNVHQQPPAADVTHVCDVSSAHVLSRYKRWRRPGGRHCIGARQDDADPRGLGVAAAARTSARRLLAADGGRQAAGRRRALAMGEVARQHGGGHLVGERLAGGGEPRGADRAHARTRARTARLRARLRARGGRPECREGGRDDGHSRRPRGAGAALRDEHCGGVRPAVRPGC